MPILQRSQGLRTRIAGLRRGHRNLPPQRAEVAALLAFGLSPDEIANARETSLSTTRNQIRSLLA